MNILKSDIVNKQYDVLWEDIMKLVKDAAVKEVLVVVNEHEKDGTESAQLQKMLNACKLSPEQYNVIGLQDGQMAAWHKLRELLDPKIIFLIGVAPAQLGISALFNLNFPNHFDERIWLPTLSIKELEQKEEVKKQLWINGMKPIFVDKIQ